MTERVTRASARRVLIVDDELGQATTAGGRAVEKLADELRARGIEVLEALSIEDGLATVVSDSAIHCVFVNWTLGANERHSHERATELLRAVRVRNAKVPIFLMADRKLAGTVTVEVATLADEFVWLLEDTAGLPGGSGRCRDRTLHREHPPAIRGGTGALRPGSRVFIGGPRPSGRCRLPQVARRARLLRLLRREPVSHRHGHRARRPRLAARATRDPSARANDMRRACSAPIAPTRFSTAPRPRTGRSCRRASATARSRSAIATATSRLSRDWSPLAASRSSSVPHAIATGSSGRFLRRGSSPRRSRRRSRAIRWPRRPRRRARSTRWSPTAPTTACATTPSMREALLAKSVDRIHFDEAWYGYARFNPMYRDRYAMRGDPADHPTDGPTVFATHSTHKCLAALSQTSYIHIRDGRGAIDHGRFNEAYCSQASTSPLYALIASNDVAAAMMDGPAGQTLTQDVIDEAVACRLAVARIRQEFLRKKDWFFAPWNAEEVADPKTGKRIPFHETPAERLAIGPDVLGPAPRRELARLRRHSRRMVHARPDQGRHHVPGHEAGRAARQATEFRRTSSLPISGVAASCRRAPPTTWCSSCSRSGSPRGSGAR